jgi:hypothetical protein
VFKPGVRWVGAGDPFSKTLAARVVQHPEDMVEVFLFFRFGLLGLKQQHHLGDGERDAVAAVQDQFCGFSSFMSTEHRGDEGRWGHSPPDAGGAEVAEVRALAVATGCGVLGLSRDVHPCR